MVRHRVSPVGLELVKRFEGLRRRAARLPDGGWTVGYGHTASAREGATVDEADAEALLRYDLQSVERLLDAVVYTPLTPNQTAALAAFAYSVGADAFKRSDVLKRVNEGDLLAAAAALEGWRRAEFEGEVIVVDALVRRRSAEKALFLTPSEGFIPAPSTALRPQQDGRGAVATSPAVELTAPLDGDTVAVERAPGDLGAPSPAQIAAAAVSRRLAALFPDEPETELAPVRDATPEPEVGSDPAFAPASDADVSTEPPQPQGLVEVVVQPSAAELILPDGDDGLDTFDRRIAQAEPDDARPSEPAESFGPYVILGLIGFALFVVGVLIILQGRGAGETGFTGQQSVLGGVLGLIGIGAFCTAVYEWLRTVGRGDGAAGGGGGGH